MKAKIRRIIVAFLVVMFAMTGMSVNSNKAEAAGGYKIKINKQQNCVTIYQADEKGKYKPIKAMVCSVGAATPLGTFSLKEKIRWHELEGPVYGQYCTRITGHILFHSVWYYKNNEPATLSYAQYNKLGQVASHGCVRLCVGDSRWIYNNVPSGTPVTIYNAKDPGPLGKPEAIKLKGYTGWDPTDDTNPANPYNKKKPVISLKKGISKNNKVPFASALDVMKNITAKNTTGFDAIKKVKYTVKYKANNAAEAKKVKKVNTKRAGIYIVKYTLTDEINRKASLTVKYRVTGKVSLSSITLNRKTKTLFLNGSSSDAKFKLSLKSFAPAAASITDLTFKSYNTKIATIDMVGNVKARGVGTVRIRAKAKDGSKVKAYCYITVKKYADSVTASLDRYDYSVGETAKISQSLMPSDATGSKKLKYTYSSSAPGIVSVEGDGTIKTMAPGTAVITVMAEGAAKDRILQTQLTVNVKPGATDVTPSAIDITPASIAVNN